jgi:hypothetical protein
MEARAPLLVVDAANVVGSVPDGWWRDRAGATRRLRDALVRVAADGLTTQGAPAALRRGPLDIVLVVEGRARGVPGVTGVQIVSSPGSGDDAIVDFVREHAGERHCYVATADRELSARVQHLGAEVIGPRTVHPSRLVR